MARTPWFLAGGVVTAHDLAGAAAADAFVGLAAYCLDLGELHALGIGEAGLGGNRFRLRSNDGRVVYGRIGGGGQQKARLGKYQQGKQSNG